MKIMLLCDLCLNIVLACYVYRMSSDLHEWRREQFLNKKVK